MNTDKLKKILADHKVWVESGEQRGKRAEVSYADLTGADLRNADLRNAHLGNADLRWADLSGADLSGANLIRANLNGADLRNADLTGADLILANLTGAHFELEFKSVRYFRNAIFSEVAIPWVILHPRWSEWADSVKLV